VTKQLVLDTSLFVNPASAAAMGASPTDAFSNFLELSKKCEGVSSAEVMIISCTVLCPGEQICAQDREHNCNND
jgi:predicted DNA-binding protein (UPF0278 family)